MVLNDKGIFSKAEFTTERYNEAKAREALETILIGIAHYEKYTNPKYNQDDFLDEIIRKEVEEGDTKGDVAIAGEYAFALDRSVPKLGDYLGTVKDLVFPTVNATFQLANDSRKGTITVTTSETKNGINKIEIWLNGQRIDSLTKIYPNTTTEIKENFEVNKNGVYTVKVYSKLSESAKIEAKGIVPAVEFSPDGNTDWKKEHSTKITVKETGETITGMKYKWTTSESNEPKPEEFTQNCTNNSTITGKDMNGTQFLWVLLEINGGKTTICGSKGFNFDNTGPTITEFTSTKYSESGITLKAIARDPSLVVSMEFLIDGSTKLLKSPEINQTEWELSGTFEGLSTGQHKIKVISYDSLGNCSEIEKYGETKQYLYRRV